MIVRTAKEISRDDGSYIRFDDNSAVLLDGQREPVGTRIFGPVARELRAKPLSQDYLARAGGAVMEASKCKRTPDPEERPRDGHQGRDRGKTGKVMRVVPQTGRVLVERLTWSSAIREPRGAASPGGIIEKEAPIAISNVMLFCDRCNAPVRIGCTIRDSRANAPASAGRCGEQWVTTDG